MPLERNPWRYCPSEKEIVSGYSTDQGIRIRPRDQCQPRLVDTAPLRTDREDQGKQPWGGDPCPDRSFRLYVNMTLFDSREKQKEEILNHREFVVVTIAQQPTKAHAVVDPMGAMVRTVCGLSVPGTSVTVTPAGCGLPVCPECARGIGGGVPA